MHKMNIKKLVICYNNKIYIFMAYLYCHFGLAQGLLPVPSYCLRNSSVKPGSWGLWGHNRDNFKALKYVSFKFNIRYAQLLIAKVKSIFMFVIK